MIVEKDYYNDTYMGESVDNADFPRFSTRAQNAILLMCRGRVSAENFETLPANIRLAIKQAICAQIEYYDDQGAAVAISGTGATSFTVGKVSVGRQGGANSGGGGLICAASIAILEQTGLLSPHVPVWG